MHIPDGYLSPQTYVPLWGAFVALAAVAVKKIKAQFDTKMVPFMGMAASFSFLIMMFNVPIPGGSTGHAVGAAVIALLLGPWVSFVAVTVALIIQALVFGDGGITALGANCFNMAFVMSFVAWYVFKFVQQKSQSVLRIEIAAFIAAYISINVTAFITAVEFGIQPLIATSASGQPLYAPYPLRVAVPVMALEHLLIFGFIEAVVTLLIIRYFIKNNKQTIAAIQVHE